MARSVSISFNIAEKGGWAIMPGSKAVDSGVPQACAAILSAPKKATSAESNTTDDDRRDARRTSPPTAVSRISWPTTPTGTSVISSSPD